MDGHRRCLRAWFIATFGVFSWCSLHGFAAANVNSLPSVAQESKFSSGSFGLHHGRELEAAMNPDFLVDEPPLILTYHNGPVLSQAPTMPVYVIWYGTFNASQISTIIDFFASIPSTPKQEKPSVSSWWKITANYRDSKGMPVSGSVSVAGQSFDKAYSKGKSLTATNVEALVLSSLATFPTDSNALYLVLTAHDVYVDSFCMDACATHLATEAVAITKQQQLPYAWVGNSMTQCAGKCAWPFAQAQYGPKTAPLLPPNGDVGIDGMIINIASMLAGAATNPFNNGFYQGDGAAPLEAATACAGMFGDGASPGIPGRLLVDPATGSSFNAYGVNNRKFLLPELWSPSSLSCTPPSG